jgi:hypothetical protein
MEKVEMVEMVEMVGSNISGIENLVMWFVVFTSECLKANGNFKPNENLVDVFFKLNDQFECLGEFQESFENIKTLTVDTLFTIVQKLEGQCEEIMEKNVDTDLKIVNTFSSGTHGLQSKAKTTIRIVRDGFLAATAAKKLFESKKKNTVEMNGDNNEFKTSSKNNYLINGDNNKIEEK